MVSRATTRPAFNLAYPLKDRHGAIAGVISVGFVIDRYREILNNMSLLPGTSYVLSDHRGVVLSRAIDPERYIGTPYPANACFPVDRYFSLIQSVSPKTPMPIHIEKMKNEPT